MKKRAFIILTILIMAAMVIMPNAASAAPDYLKDYTDDERHMAQVMEREAGTSSKEGRLAVGCVIMNRLENPIWGDSSITEVLLHAGQFGMSNFDTLEKRTPSKESLQLARSVISGGKRILPKYVEYFKSSNGSLSNGLYYWGSHVLYKKIGGNYFFFDNKTHYTSWKKANGGGSSSGNSSSSSGSSSGYYTVQAGDSVYVIAKKHGMTMAQLKSLNGLTNNLIHPGQKLKVSGGGSSSSSSSGGGSGTYTVKAGDSIYAISKKFGMTMAQLKSLNGLKDNFIYPGQKLKVSGGSGSSSGGGSGTYTVQSGDSIYAISKKFGMTMAQLKSLNGLKDNFIYPGQKLKVSGGGSSSSSSSGGSGTYTVQAGDCVYTIARKHGMTMAQLKALNNMSSDFVYAGQKLKVSGGSSSSSGGGSGTHTVKAGESLYSIAKKYSTTIAKLKSLNGLSSDMIYPNQKLKVG